MKRESIRSKEVSHFAIKQQILKSGKVSAKHSIEIGSAFFLNWPGMDWTMKAIKSNLLSNRERREEMQIGGTDFLKRGDRHTHCSWIGYSEKNTQINITTFFARRKQHTLLTILAVSRVKRITNEKVETKKVERKSNNLAVGKNSTYCFKMRKHTRFLQLSPLLPEIAASSECNKQLGINNNISRKCQSCMSVWPCCVRVAICIIIIAFTRHSLFSLFSFPFFGSVKSEKKKVRGWKSRSIRANQLPDWPHKQTDGQLRWAITT